MEKGAKKNWWQERWPIPLSVLLHVLVVAIFYLQWPGSVEAPAEPESVNVELVEPPKEEPPKEEPPAPEKAEEKKAEEPPPPPEAKPEEPTQPAPPLPSMMSSVPIRPESTQMDERDDPAEQEAAGKDQPKPEQPAEEQQAATAPSPQPADEEAVPPPPAATPTAPQGEIAAAESPADPADLANVAVPLPKPETKPAPQQPATTLVDGDGDPTLKPAKKIIAAAKRPGPMMRQIFGNLSPTERVMQLCFAEVVAQIKAARNGQPLEGLQFLKRDIANNVLTAKGAFNIGPQWFPLDYRCEVNVDRYIVTDFRFDIKPELSTDEVRRLGLRSQ
ncbi:DUF930 domain-containing protein [Rhizobium sp. Leaf262]|uniref:DUF930 domain-containing protein n=1 Tax=Rhizobium sp. Leaf262 TaxID=1736312 RepID=UPI0007142D86|nr:DUF930 domain-containing protein [Rhizobium sp. Leaf262]KQO82253.1 hypothetical protein ASF29_17075 [Rhizobium sp. Leaf262]